MTAPATPDVHAALRRMRDEFITRLPARLNELRAQLAALERHEPQALQTLHRGTHSLVGAAGVHQLMQVSAAARVLERLAAAQPAGLALTASAGAALRQAFDALARAAENPVAGQAPPLPAARRATPRVMVVDDDAEQAGWLRSVLLPAGYEVDVFTSLEAFRAACEQGEPPAAVIMDMVFPEGSDAGARAIRALKAQSLSGLPVIFVSVRQDMAARLAAYRAGATRYLTKPLARETVLRLLGETSAQAPDQPYRVLLVDDDPEPLQVQAEVLRQAGMEVRTLADPLQALQELEHFAAEALVLDMYMPQCSGPELAAILADDPRLAEIPVIYLSAETNISLQLVALDRGGDHFLTKPVEPRHLIAAVTLHARRLRKAREQRQSLADLHYERERQQAALDAHAIVSMTDAQGKILYVNDKFCQVSGYSREELVGQNHRIVKSAEHPPAFYAAMWQTISNGHIWQGEVCNRAKDGRLYWVESTIVPFLDAGGLPYRYVSIRTDITQTMLAARLNEQRQRELRQIFDAFPGVIVRHDEGMVYTYVNRRFAELFGKTPEQIVGMSLAELQGAEREAAIRDKWKRLMVGEIVATEAVYPANAFHGEVVLQVSNTVITDAETGCESYYMLGIDITPLKKAEKDLLRAKDAAEAASRAKSEFLASMSHELRTPLNAIIGFSQIFGLDPALSGESRAHAREIETAGNHLLSLVNGLIDLARVESGQMDLSLEPVQLGTVLAESLAMVAPIAAKQDIALTGAFEAQVRVTVRADFVRLRQVVINLLSNAIKYNRPRGSVRLVCEPRPEGRVRMSVVDTGPGIPADKQDRIFNAFDRLGAERSAIEGTGIGLVLTKRMVEAMGGEIGFDSVAGQGSTFWVEFPLLGQVAEALPAMAPQTGAPAPGAAAPPAARLVVLYVEDNPINLRLMQQIFARRPELELRDAHTAEIGIELARAEPPALILMDINLPGMDGYQALGVLKADPATASIPVVAVSANAMLGDRERGMASGFLSYVTKPIDVPRFLELLDRLLAEAPAAPSDHLTKRGVKP